MKELKKTASNDSSKGEGIVFGQTTVDSFSDMNKPKELSKVTMKFGINH